MSGADSRKTQFELLSGQLLQALSREGGPPAGGTLTFDGGFAATFEAAGHQLVVAPPDGTWPELARRRFDLVLGVGLIERAADARASLTQAAKVLAEEGLLLLATPKAIAGREPPSGCLRHFAIVELASLLMRSGLMATELLADGPELLVVTCRLSQEVGADLVAEVADAVARSEWERAEALLSSMTDQMESEDLVQEYAMLVGHVHLGRGRLRAALDAFGQASELVGPSALPLTAMGAVALSASDLEAAKELFEGALRLCPTHSPALRGLGMTLEAMGDTKAALTSFDMAATQRPADGELAEKVVELAVSLGQPAPATHAIERYSQRTGNDRWAHRLLDRLDPDGRRARPSQRRPRREAQSGAPR